MIEPNLKKLPTSQELDKLKKLYPDIDESAVYVVLKYTSAAKSISQAYNVFFEKFQLTDAKFTVLMLLNRQENQTLTPSEIASQAGITRGSATTLLDGLESMKLISRSHDAYDRRKIFIKLTSKGKAKLEEVLPIHYQLTNLVTTYLSNEQQEVLLKSISALEKGIELFKKNITEVTTNE